MQILLGDGGGKRLQAICHKHGFGRMLAQNWPTLYPNEPWGFDNGAFGLWQQSKGAKSLKDDEGIGIFLVRLNESMKRISWPPYLAVLPDIVAGGNESLDFSLSWIGKLPDWPWYLAVQDGMDPRLVIDNLHLVSGIFLGGSDAYKQYGPWWCKIAHQHKIKFHYGRCGTLNKLASAIRMGVDSLDSSFPLWTKDRLFAFIQALSQEDLPGITTFCRSPYYGGLVEFNQSG